MSTDLSFDRVYVEVTNSCNLRCSFCPGTRRPATAMTLDFFTFVLDQVRSLTKQVCLHVMGEPLTHPQFPDLLDLCAQAGLAVNLTTNGVLIDHFRNVIVNAAAVRQVNFSLQALGTSRPRLDAVLAFCRHALASRPELYLNLRLWNLDSLHSQSTNEKADELLGHIARYLDIPMPTITPGRKSRKLLGRLYLHQDTRFVWPGQGNTVERRHGYCHALSSHFAILADGQVCPCCLDADGVLVLGNVRNSSLPDILRSPKAMAMRHGFARGELVEQTCRQCTYCRRFPPRTRHRAVASCDVDS